MDEEKKQGNMRTHTDKREAIPKLAEKRERLTRKPAAKRQQDPGEMRQNSAGGNAVEGKAEKKKRVRRTAGAGQETKRVRRTAGAGQETKRVRRTAGAGQETKRVRRSVALAEETARLSDASRRRRDHENERKMQLLSILLGVLTVTLIAAIIYEIVLGHGTRQTGAERMAATERPQEMENNILQNDNDIDTESGEGADSSSGNELSSDITPADGGTASDAAAADDTAASADGSEGAADAASLQREADLKAAQYDYDGAISLLKNAAEYGENAEFQSAVAEYEAQKAACVAYPAEKVTHIFFHTLIHDPAKAFDGDEYEAGYNQFMVTEHEFNSILEQMYEKGYVMVFLDDIAPAEEGADGSRTFVTRDLMLPEGKIPFVLSQDDVSYYHYMEGDGFASRLIVDENGDVKNEYIEDDGSVSVGDYDMVPLVDRFVEKHPDFSYRGAKGYVALTGYEGILGYRTDEVYKTKEAGRVTVQQQMFFDSYPGGFDEAAFERECGEARKVAEAMKKNGWRFASHTWGHQNLSETDGIPYENFVRDTDRWETWVEPLIGETDTIIYAFGGDIRGWETYSGERYEYLKEQGFDYFCGVDSAPYWLQVEPGYVRQSRRNVDGYRMYYNPEMLADLFDVQKAWDPQRPSYVPPI